jgi:hypothetical protein
MRTYIALMLLLMLPLPSSAWISTRWTYEAMYEKADLIVVAKPVSVSQPDEATSLPDISPKMRFYELKAAFVVSIALKGTNPETLQLRYVKLANPEQFALAGPSLVQFDPAQRHSYLMFLSLDPGGSYSPVTGQTNAATAIIRLEGNAQ